MFVGRLKEIKILKDIETSEQAEFLALYGRRRVGKTYLIRHVFAKSHHYLEFVGQHNTALKQQLESFHKIFNQKFYPSIPLQKPSSWNEALQRLTDEFQKMDSQQPIILFFDELPWLCSRKSGFLQALDYFWNKFWSQMKPVKLIVCGSAAGWMLNNIIKAKGGLHHRLTHTLCIEPFSLKDTKEYLQARKFKFTDRGILEIYMALGGIPYYLSLIPKGCSVAEILDQLFFQSQAPLRDEFPHLFFSLYEHAETYMLLMKAIAKAHYGLTREQIIERTKIPSGGRLDQRLFALEASGFIHSIPLFDKKKDKRYRIKDPFLHFYMSWVEEFVQKQQALSSYWVGIQNTGSYESWAGYAFEHICFFHMRQILQALKLEGNVKTIGIWWNRPKIKSSSTGTQIDLLIERRDRALTVCEMKFSYQKIIIDKMMATTLKNRILLLSEAFPHREIFVILIAPEGYKNNIWSEDLIENSVTLQDLFQ